MKCKKSGQGGIVHGEAASDSLHEGLASVGHSGEKVGNNGSPSKGHLTSGENVTYKGGYYCEEKENYSDISGLFIQVRAVVKASSDVEVDADKEEGCSVGVYVANYSAVVYIPTDVGDR